MHTMHKACKKSISRRDAVISISYEVKCTRVDMLWEQEVPSSNLGAPTNNFKYLELIFKCFFCGF